jgi:predicted peroxiredoxin
VAKLVVSITHSRDNVDKASLGFVVANAAVASGVETVVFLSTEGAYLSQRGFADDLHEEGFAPLKAMIDSFICNGGAIWVCTTCFKKRGLSQSELLDNTKVVGGAKLVEYLSQGAACVSY